MVQQMKSLDEAGLSKIQAMENMMGCCIVAVESGSTEKGTGPGQQYEPAMITEEQVADIQALEYELQSVLIAYKC